MKTRKDAFFYVLLVVINLIFISYSKYIYNNISSSLAYRFLINNSDFYVLSNLVVPIILIVTLFIYFSFYNPSVQFDIIFIDILFVYTITFKDLKVILDDNQIVVFYYISLLLFVMTSRKYCSDLSSSDITEKSIINSDKEITSLDENERTTFNYLLKSFLPILYSHNSNSLSISISGKWGSGKSSFISLIKKEIKGKRHFITIDFYPWLYDSSNAITYSFFHSLLSKIDPSIGINNSIRKYLNILTSKSSLFSRYMDTISNIDTKKLFNKINNGLQKSSKKIVVFIDDLDRLEKGELLSVLKIIRNSARFDNIIFISAIDKKEVSKIIDRDIEYLGKFFQYDRYIPPMGSIEKMNVFKSFFMKNIIVKDNVFPLKDIPVNVQLYLVNIREIKEYISRLNVAIHTQQSIEKLCISIVNKHEDLELNHLKRIKLSNEKIAITTLISMKSLALIRSDNEYLNLLKEFLNDTKSDLIYKDKNSKEFNDNIKRNFPEILEIEHDSYLKNIFKDLFRSDKHNVIGVSKSYKLYFDNYYENSIPEFEILKLELIFSIDNYKINNKEELENKLGHPAFEPFRLEAYNILYGYLNSKTKFSEKIEIFHLIVFLVNLEFKCNEKSLLFSRIVDSISNIIEILLSDDYTKATFKKVINELFTIKMNPYFSVIISSQILDLSISKFTITEEIVQLYKKFILDYFKYYLVLEKIIDMDSNSPRQFIHDIESSSVLLITFCECFIDNKKEVRNSFINTFVDNPIINAHKYHDIIAYLIKNYYEELLSFFNEQVIIKLFVCSVNKHFVFRNITEKLNIRKSLSTIELQSEIRNNLPQHFRLDVNGIFTSKVIDKIIKRMSELPDSFNGKIVKDSTERWKLFK